MTGRSVPEWIGTSPDEMPPPRVRLRVFEAYGGRCYLTGRKIMPGDNWALDHIIALCNGGENSESNLAPILADRHKQKTAADVAERAKTDRIRKKHLGIESGGRPMPGSRKSAFKKKLDGTVVKR